MLADDLSRQTGLGVAAVLKLRQQAFAQVDGAHARRLQLHELATDLFDPLQTNVQTGRGQATRQIDGTLFQVAGLVQGIENAQGNLQVGGIAEHDGNLVHEAGAQIAVGRTGLPIFRNLIAGRCTQDSDVIETFFSGLITAGRVVGLQHEIPIQHVGDFLLNLLSRELKKANRLDQLRRHRRRRRDPCAKILSHGSSSRTGQRWCPSGMASVFRPAP